MLKVPKIGEQLRIRVDQLLKVKTNYTEMTVKINEIEKRILRNTVNKRDFKNNNLKTIDNK